MFVCVKLEQLIALFDRGYLSGPIYLRERRSLPSDADGVGADEPVLLELERQPGSVTLDCKLGLGRLVRIAVRSESARDDVESLLDQCAPHWQSLTGPCEVLAEEADASPNGVPVRVVLSEPHRRLLSAWRAVVAASPPDLVWIRRLLAADFSWLVGDAIETDGARNSEQAVLRHVTRQAIAYLSRHTVADGVPAPVVLGWLGELSWLPRKAREELELIVAAPTAPGSAAASEVHEILVVLRLHLRADYLLAFMKQAHRGVAISDERRLRLWFLCGLADTSPLEGYLNASDVLIRHALSETLEDVDGADLLGFLESGAHSPPAGTRDLRLELLLDGRFALRQARGEWLSRRFKGSAGWNFADWSAPETQQEALAIARTYGWRDLLSIWGSSPRIVQLRMAGDRLEPLESAVWEIAEERVSDFERFRERLSSVSEPPAAPSRLISASLPVWPEGLSEEPASAPPSVEAQAVSEHAVADSGHSAADPLDAGSLAHPGAVTREPESVPASIVGTSADSAQSPGTPGDVPGALTEASTGKGKQGKTKPKARKSPRQEQNPNTANDNAPASGVASATSPESGGEAHHAATEGGEGLVSRANDVVTKDTGTGETPSGITIVTGATASHVSSFPEDLPSQPASEAREQLSLLTDVGGGRREPEESSELGIVERTRAPAGLIYVPRFLSRDEAEALAAEIDARPWQDDLQRRVQHYGYRYDYKERFIDPERSKTTPLPELASVLAARISDFLATKGHRFRFTQMIVNEYLPGQGISPHVDHPAFRGPVVSVSLLSDIVMDFEKRGDQRFEQVLERDSMVALTGPAREEWTHAIKARKSDVIHGRRVYRQRRVSLTYRVF